MVTKVAGITGKGSVSKGNPLMGIRSIRRNRTRCPYRGGAIAASGRVIDAFGSAASADKRNGTAPAARRVEAKTRSSARNTPIALHQNGATIGAKLRSHIPFPQDLTRVQHGLLSEKRTSAARRAVCTVAEHRTRIQTDASSTCGR